MGPHVTDRLSAYLDGELPALERGAVEGHLGTCDACTRRLEELAAVDEGLRALPDAAPDGYFDSFPSRVRQRLEPHRTRGSLPAWTWAAAAALLLAVITPLTLRTWRPRAAEPVGVAPPTEPSLAARAYEVPRAGELARGAAPADKERQEVSTPLATERLQKAEAAQRHDAPDGLRDALQEKRPADEAKLFQRDLRALGYAGASPPPAATPPPAAAVAAARPPGRGGPYAQNQLRNQAPEQRERVAADENASADPVGFAPAPASPEQGATAMARPTGAPRKDDEDAPSVAEEGRRPGRKAVPPAPAGTLAAPEPSVVHEEATRPAAATAMEAFSSENDAVAGAGENQFQRLVGRQTASLEEARSLREAWRAFSRRHPVGPRADEARVQVIVAGVAAWQLGHDPGDKSLVQRDAAAYLAREDAAQADRVRTLLQGIDRQH
jgi:hypothetical protein